MSYWRDKVMLITGGSAGLGRVIAGCAARAGASLVLADINAQQLDAAVEELRAAGRHAVGSQTDVTDPQQVERMIADAVGQYGRLDALVNCVGRSTRGRIADTSANDFRELIELNFLTAVHCTHAALPHLLEARGHVVNIGSLAAKTGSAMMGAYPASKFPLAAYSQQLRLELGPEGLHVLLVCPGPLRRDDAGTRYDDQATGLPEAARKPGGGAKLKAVDPHSLAERILRACQQRKPELIVPAKVKWLWAISQLSPSLGDWILKKKTSN